MKRSLDKVSTSDVGAAGGVCPLGQDKKVPEKYLPASSGGDSSLLDASGYIDPAKIRQGAGSGLNAEYLSGKPASSFALGERRILTQYPLKGGGDLRGDVTIGLSEDVLNGTLDHTRLRNIGTNTHDQIDAHLANTANPHGVTVSQIGAAPAAKGVTNGDAHDHNGGDGGQIAHTSLSGAGTNTHAQIDTFMGLASVDPAPGAIPVADAYGSLDAWISGGITGSFFESDSAGDLMPVSLPADDINFELDGNYDIQPRA